MHKEQPHNGPPPHPTRQPAHARPLGRPTNPARRTATSTRPGCPPSARPRALPTPAGRAGACPPHVRGRVGPGRPRRGTFSRPPGGEGDERGDSSPAYAPVFPGFSLPGVAWAGIFPEGACSFTGEFRLFPSVGSFSHVVGVFGWSYKAGMSDGVMAVKANRPGTFVAGDARASYSRRRERKAVEGEGLLREMRHVLANPATTDESYGEKAARRFYKSDPKAFLLKWEDLEAAERLERRGLEREKTGRVGADDEGEGRILELIDRLLAEVGHAAVQVDREASVSGRGVG